MKVYLAARYSRHEELQAYRKDLESIGHEVTSRWINGGHQISKEELGEAANAKRVQFAQEDWSDLMAADCCISFTEIPRTTTTRGGRHVEFGAALATGQRCIVVGPLENIFHCLPGVEHFATWPECMKAIEEPAP